MDFTIDAVSKPTRFLGVVGCAVIFYYNAVDDCVPADGEGGAVGSRLAAEQYSAQEAW